MRFDIGRMSRRLSLIVLFSLLVYLLRMFSFPFTYMQQAEHLRWTLLVLLLFVLKFSREFFENRKRLSALFLALFLSVSMLFLYRYYRRLPKEEWTYEEAGVRYYVYPQYAQNTFKKESDRVLYWTFYYQDLVFEEYFYPEAVFVKFPEEGKSWNDPSTEKHYTESFDFLGQKEPVLQEEAIEKIAQHRFEFQSEDYALVLRDHAMHQELWEVFIQKKHWESLGYLEEHQPLMDVIVNDTRVFFAHAPESQNPLIYQSSQLPQMEQIHFDEVISGYDYLFELRDQDELLLSPAPWEEHDRVSIYRLEDAKAKWLRMEPTP